MISVSGKNWEEISINKRLVEKIKIDHNFSEIISKLIVERNYSDKEIYSLNNNICFSNPFLENKDFISAVDLLKLHLNKKSKFLVIGDYDVDGCVSTSLIINFLNKFSVNNTFYIPDRVVDGYGANINLIKKLINKEIPDLIIMVDCGSNSKNTINFLNKNKIDTIIIDHHNINHPYPKSNVLINPKKKCDYSKYDYYCSAFLTFLFLDLYIKKNRLKININNQLIYVALATIADVMPLRENNRFILKKIVENFDINKDLFLNTLFKLNNLNKKLDYEDLAYIVAPTINSAGRISNANIVVELLTTSNKIRIKKITNDLFAFNLKRKKIENIAMKKFEYEKFENNKGIIFYLGNNIPEGIIGIIASKLKEYYNKPTIVFSQYGNLLKGSARSIPSFNISQYINLAIEKSILISGGGHNLAAGMSLKKMNLNIFKNFLNQNYLKKEKSESNKYFSKISFTSLNFHLLNELNKFEPFGNQNNKIIFLIEKVRIIKPMIIKDKFISCFIKTKMNKLIKAISFNHIDSPISMNLLSQKNEINILAKISKNNWNNKTNIQLEIVDLISNNT